MSVCLTGDIHHSSMKSPEQKFSELSESQVAEQYLSIAENFQIKVTLFVTGKCVSEQIDDLRKLQSFKQLELGGHTYDALRPLYLHRLFKATAGSFYGPSWYQRRDIELTLRCISRELGVTPISWRTHGYLSNASTLKCLREFGVTIISDEVNPYELIPHRVTEKVWSLPINTMPDHEHLIHADRNKEVITNLIRGGWSDAFTSESFTANRWAELIKNQTAEIVSRHGIATILAHPLCMYTTDRMRTFSKICEFLSAHQTVFASQTRNFSIEKKQHDSKRDQLND